MNTTVLSSAPILLPPSAVSQAGSCTPAAMTTATPSKRRAPLQNLDVNATSSPVRRVHASPGKASIVLSSTTTVTTTTTTTAAAAAAVVAMRAASMSPLKKVQRVLLDTRDDGEVQEVLVEEDERPSKKVCLDDEARMDMVAGEELRESGAMHGGGVDEAPMDVISVVSGASPEAAMGVNATTPTEAAEEQGASRPGRLTREETRKRAETLRLSLSLASYKLRTNQVDTPLERLASVPAQQSAPVLAQTTATSTQATATTSPSSSATPPSTFQGHISSLQTQSQPKSQTNTDTNTDPTPALLPSQILLQQDSSDEEEDDRFDSNDCCQRRRTWQARLDRRAAAATAAAHRLRAREVELSNIDPELRAAIPDDKGDVAGVGTDAEIVLEGEVEAEVEAAHGVDHVRVDDKVSERVGVDMDMDTEMQMEMVMTPQQHRHRGRELEEEEGLMSSGLRGGAVKGLLRLARGLL